MKRPLLLSAVALLVLGIALHYVGALRTLRLDDLERERHERINRSTRVLAYPVDVKRALVLPLRPDDTELRLLTNLVLPAAPPANKTPATTPEHEYGLACRFLTLEGHLVWSSTFWERTRKTRIEDPARALALEEAFCDDPNRTVFDTRATHLLVRHLVARGARRVEIRLVDNGAPRRDATTAAAAFSETGGYVLVRVMRLVTLPERDALHRWSRLEERQREALLEQLDAYGEDLLPENERHAIIRRSWELVAAEADEDGDHPSVPLYLDSSWRSFAPLGDALPLKARSGLMLFLRRGMWGWTRVLSVTANTSREQIYPSSAARPTHGGHSAVVHVLAAIAMSIHDRRSP